MKGPVDCLVPCGDGICQSGENTLSCPTDCTICGDSVCGSDESLENCPADCAAACGNGKCEGGESAEECPVDCGPCGDGVCGYSEFDETCPADCLVGCGDGVCDEEGGESTQTCANDCVGDLDGDGVDDEEDNCPFQPNEKQEDNDEDPSTGTIVLVSVGAAVMIAGEIIFLVTQDGIGKDNSVVVPQVGFVPMPGGGMFGAGIEF